MSDPDFAGFSATSDSEFSGFSTMSDSEFAGFSPAASVVSDDRQNDSLISAVDKYEPVVATAIKRPVPEDEDDSDDVPLASLSRHHRSKRNKQIATSPIPSPKQEEGPEREPSTGAARVSVDHESNQFGENVNAAEENAIIEPAQPSCSEPQDGPDPAMTIRPSHPWCMHCFRAALWQYKQQHPKPITFLEVECSYEGVSSKRCVRCSSGSKYCYPVPSLMAGDREDLSMLIDWARTSAGDSGQEDDDDEKGKTLLPLLGPEYRHRLAIAAWRLCENFEAAEKAHRKSFSLVGALKTTQESRLAYGMLAAERRAYLLPSVPPPVFTPDPEYQELRAAWERRQALRLLFGDPGSVCWQVAKHAFKHTVEQVFQDAAMDADSPMTERRSRQWAELFPVEIDVCLLTFV